MTENPMQKFARPLAQRQLSHAKLTVSDNGQVAIVTLNRPERKNPLTFDSYAELRDFFRELQYASDIRVVILTWDPLESTCRHASLSIL